MMLLYSKILPNKINENLKREKFERKRCVKNDEWWATTYKVMEVTWISEIKYSKPKISIKKIYVIRPQNRLQVLRAGGQIFGVETKGRSPTGKRDPVSACPTCFDSRIFRIAVSSDLWDHIPLVSSRLKLLSKFTTKTEKSYKRPKA